MAYDKEKIVAEMKKAIKKHKLKFFYQIFAYVPCCEQTGTDILKHLGELGAIKKLLDSNKILSKVKALNRWENSENPTLEVAFYKLLANDDELERLNNKAQKTEVVIKSDRNLDELNDRIAKMENEANEQEYDTTQD